MPDNKDKVAYDTYMKPQGSSGPSEQAAKGTGEFAQIPVVNKEAHAGEEPLGDTARKLKAAKPAATPAAPDKAPAKKPIPDSMKNAPSYKHGTDRVPSTGPAILHRDEAVLNKDEADKYRASKKGMFSHIAGLLGGEDKPKKELKEIRTRKAENGNHIHEHHFTHPEHHPMEEHTSEGTDGMVDHMMQHMSDPDEGEEAAEAGNNGIQPAGAMNG